MSMLSLVNIKIGDDIVFYGVSLPNSDISWEDITFISPDKKTYTYEKLGVNLNIQTVICNTLDYLKHGGLVC